MSAIEYTPDAQQSLRGLAEKNVMYYLCSAGDDRRNTACSILRGLLYQLLQIHSWLVKHLIASFETVDALEKLLGSSEGLWRCLKSIFSDAELGPSYCVLDVLDE